MKYMHICLYIQFLYTCDFRIAFMLMHSVKHVTAMFL